MKVTIDMVILIVCSANTLGIVLLLIFYCTQIRYLKKKMIGLGMRPPAVKNKASSDLGQMIRTRPRSNSWVVGTRPSFGKSEKCSQTMDEESSTSSSSVNKYPIPPLPKMAINNSLRTQNNTNTNTNTIEQGLLNGDN